MLVSFSSCFMVQVDGGFSNWTAWSACLRGFRWRERVCNNPPPSNGGAHCVGDNKETTFCDSPTESPGTEDSRD